MKNPVFLMGRNIDLPKMKMFDESLLDPIVIGRENKNRIKTTQICLSDFDLSKIFGNIRLKLTKQPSESDKYYIQNQKKEVTALDKRQPLRRITMCSLNLRM